MFGIAKKEACFLNVDIGKVTGILVDEEANQTEAIPFLAFLADTDQVPLIIGFKDLLEHCKVVFDYLLESGKIATDIEGKIGWIWDPEMVRKYLSKPHLKAK